MLGLQILHEDIKRKNNSGTHVKKKEQRHTCTENAFQFNIID